MSRLMLPAATNYCTNPSFELDTNSDGLSDGWSNVGNVGGSIQYSRVAGRLGGYAQRVQYTSPGGESGKVLSCAHDATAVGSFAPGDVVTFSLYLKGTFTGVAPTIIVYTVQADGATQTGAAVADVSASVDYVRYSISYTAPALTSLIWARLRIPGVDDGDTFDFTIDDVQIEKSSILTPYFDGSMAGCSWSGTANASTSVRAISRLEFVYAGLTGAGGIGTFAARVVPLFPGTDDTVRSIVGLKWVSGPEMRRFGIQHGDTGSYHGFWTGDYGGGISGWPKAGAADASAIGTVHTIVSRKSSTFLDINIDGVDASAVATTEHTGTAPLLVVGGNGDTILYESSCAYIGPVLISPQRKSDEWVAAIQADSGAAFDDINLLMDTYMEVGDMLLPLTSNGNALVKGIWTR